MTLSRLLLAWLCVAAWFLAVTWAVQRLATTQRPADLGAARRAAGWTLAEAGVVTLFASLWFDSLGSGGWGLVFLLVGLLAAFPVRLRGVALANFRAGPAVMLAALDTIRYLGAGALLAWRLR
jgi:hypothetical protein